MDNVLNQNEKALEETLACSSSKAVKTALGGLRRLNKDRCAIEHTLITHLKFNLGALLSCTLNITIAHLVFRLKKFKYFFMVFDKIEQLPFIFLTFL